ncbi:MAG: OmpA family protein [Spirochaetes bacterium]|nr:OmpA family protein [Spirochaetota bacterium]
MRILFIIAVFIAAATTALPQLMQAENLGSNVNSAFDELSPVIAPDGKMLYFVRQNHPENKLEGKRTLAIWTSELDAAGKMKQAIHLGDPFNQTVYNSIFSVTPSGSLLILGAYENGVYQGSGFSIVSRAKDGGWNAAKKIVIQGYETLEKKSSPDADESRLRSAYLANDEKTLLFSASSGGDENDSDIYISLLSNGVWTKPVNLGTQLNSEANEITPFLASDGETLYFSSDRGGNYDIYIARRLEKNWKKWSKPIALPAPINSPAWEAYFSTDALGENAYVVSYKNSIGRGDIVRVKMTPDLRPAPVILGAAGAVVKRAEIEPGMPVFSPNGDGRKDTITFTPKLTVPAGVQSIVITVSEQKSKRVVFTASNASISPLVWNGTGSDGSPVSDGDYAVKLTAYYSAVASITSEPKPFSIDTVPPLFEISAANLTFSPNGAVAAKRIKIDHHRISPKEPDEVLRGSFADSNGIVVLAKEFAAEPSVLNWSGRNDSNEIRQGIYTYTFSTADAAGNETNYSIAGITLIAETPKVAIACSAARFSPNGDGIADMAVFTPELSSKKGLMYWDFSIHDASGAAVYEAKASNASVPASFSWNGKNGSTYVSDGTYTAGLSVTYDIGTSAEGFTNVVADVTPPVIVLTNSPPLFSPDADGDNDTLTIIASASDVSGVSNWQIIVYPVTNGAIVSNSFKTYGGIGAVSTNIIWDGFGDDTPTNSTDDKYLVASASDYAIVATASDTLGNKTSTVPIIVHVDILVIKTAYGYKIRISSIQFESGKAVVLSKYDPILSRLSEVLGKYPQYTIRIEGHTDGVGPDAYNKDLSKNRANAVLESLVLKGLERTRFKGEGMGKTRLLFEEKKGDPELEEKRAQNRRVEFYLQK